MPNRLATATSPYLLQHRDNPVDWQQWSPEAFAEAARRDVPVLLSVGYSACHWCHVMAHESFEDDEVAALMNDRFVNVKVDREERPDVDAVYMEATLAMTGHGGWPMTVFCTPAGKPFYCGTYFPPQPRYGMPSFSQVLMGVAEAWRERREQLLEVGADGSPPLGTYGSSHRCGTSRCRPARCGGSRAARAVRPAARRLRWCAEVPTVHGAGVPASSPRPHRGRRGPAHGADHLRTDGPRRDVRPAGGRFRALLGGRQVGGAALREDAVRQRVAVARVPALVSRHRVTAGDAHRPGDRRLDAAGSATPQGGFVRCRCGQRGCRGPLLRVDSAGGRSGSSVAVLGDPGGDVRARHVGSAVAAGSGRSGPVVGRTVEPRLVA